MWQSRFHAVAITLLMHFVPYSSTHQQQTNSVSIQTQNAFATIYFYRNDTGSVIVGWLLKSSPVNFGIQTNGKINLAKIARLRNEQYFMMRLPTGKYFFDTRAMPGRLEIEVVAGNTYFLHLDRGNDCPTREPNDPLPSDCEDRNASIDIVPAEKGIQDIRRCITINEKDIKDRKLVMIPPERPSNIHSTGMPQPK